MLELAKKLGVLIETEGKDIKITAKNISTSDLDEELGAKIRSSILFVGPLLARLGRARIPMPGGCTLGKRSISAHIEAFTKAGVDISYSENHVTFTSPIKKRQPT
jgi:UDP-N-acetylglucosamine 1-carboxyvinyltransferase